MADNVGAAGFSTILVKTNVIVITLASLTQRVLAASLKDAHVIALTSKGPTADALSSKFAGDNLILFNVEINRETYVELHKKFHRIFVIVPPRVLKQQDDSAEQEMPRCHDDVTLIEYGAMNKMHFQLRGGLLPFIMIWESAVLIQFGDKCMEFVANCTHESAIRLFKSIEGDLVRKIEEIFSCGSRAIEKIEEHITRGEMLYQNEIDSVKAYLKTGKLITLTFEPPTSSSSCEQSSDAAEDSMGLQDEKDKNEAVELSSVVEVKVLALYDNIIDTVVVSLENIARLSHVDVILLFSTNFFKTGEQTCRVNLIRPLSSIGNEYAKHKKPDEIMSDLSAYFRDKAQEAKEIAFVETKRDSEKQ